MNLPSSGREKYPRSRRDGKILIDLKKESKDSFFNAKQAVRSICFCCPNMPTTGKAKHRLKPAVPDGQFFF